MEDQSNQPDQPGQSISRFEDSSDWDVDVKDSDILRAAEIYSEWEDAGRAIFRKYHAAIQEMRTRFRILDDDLELRLNRNPIHNIESRLKKPQSAFEKLERYGKPLTLESLQENILDIAGVRVICSYVDDVYKLVHMPVYFMDKKDLVPVEVQFRTIAMDFWASLEHSLKYKSHREYPDVDVFGELKECADTIEDVELRMQRLRNTIENYDEDNRENGTLAIAPYGRNETEAK